MLDYLLRDMTHPEGGLYAAEDADSLDPSSGQKKEVGLGLGGWGWGLRVGLEFGEETGGPAQPGSYK